MFEGKHKVRQLICMRTRGAVTAVPHEDAEPILAKASVKPPVPKAQHNAYMLDLYLQRQPGQRIDSSSLISTREMWITQRDMVEMKRTMNLNLEFDFKRRPINPRMIEVAGTHHLALDTVPWRTKEEGEFARAVFDGWRRDNVLKTPEDWEGWEEYFAARAIAKHSGIKVTAEAAIGIARRLYLRAWARGAWGIVRARTYADEAVWLSSQGYVTSETELKNAKRSPLVEGVVPITRRVMAFVRILLCDQPRLELQKLFGEYTEDAHAALARLTNTYGMHEDDEPEKCGGGNATASSA